MGLGGAALRRRLAARINSCLSVFLLLTLVCLPAAAQAQAPPTASPQQPAQPPAGPSAVIQRIEFVGNRRIRSETLRSRIFSRDGDVYNEDALRRDFQALWNTQYFEDIRLEEEDSTDRPNAKIIVWHVKERPTIRTIDYKGLKSAQVSDVLERFKDRKVGLSVESQFDPTKIRRAEVVLKQLLAENGRQFATIRTTYERIPATNAVRVTFNITEGPKVKVGKIDMEGNAAFSDRKIIRTMRHSRPYAVPLGITQWNVMSKTYDRRKLSEDLEIGIRGLYQDNGYFTVLVKEPVTDTVDINRGGIPGPWPLVGRKRGKATNITIPIQEGERFRMGRLVIRSSDPDKSLSLKQEFLVSIFPLKEGDIFAIVKVRKALEDYTKLYGEFGFIDFTTVPDTDIDQAKKVINLTLEFDEQKQYFIRRIEFVGNVTTRDKVIRREILLDEGDLFNNRLWEISLLRLNQLDYFEPIKAETSQEIKRNVKDATVDLILKVKEKGKQSVGLTGGVSGIAGSFIGLSYQTNNFLGLGETLTFSAELGDRQRNLLFGFTEPYLFDRPISTGFTIFSSRFSFDQARESALRFGQQVQIDPNLVQNFNQNSRGFTIFASYPLKKFSFMRLGVTYGFTDSNITAFSLSSQLLFEQLQFRNLAGPSSLRGIRSSRIVPTLSYNTIDSPINPTRGKSFFYSLSFEGGPLQGNVNAITNVFETKYFRPINKRRNVVGFRLLAAYATGFSGLVLPPFNRFFLGGEDTIRGFDIRTVGPFAYVPQTTAPQFFFSDPRQLDQFGNPILRVVSVPALVYTPTFPGGDTQGVGNIEYRIPLAGPVTLAVFFDIGVNGVLRRSQLQSDPGGVDLLRKQFPNATISNQLNLASGSNFKLRTSTGIEFVVQLPVVNAPFRIYWAYNLNRLRQTFLAPTGDFFLTDEFKRSLPPGVLESQILPQLNLLIGTPRPLPFFEPMRTFRFTVSRTF